jgi:hypothetical protein
MKIVTQSTIRTKVVTGLAFTPNYTADFSTLSQPETRENVLNLLRKQAEAQTEGSTLAAQAWHLHDSFWHYCYAR